MGEVSNAPVVRLMASTRPGRSVTKRRPSGANSIAHGTSTLLKTVSTRKRAPSRVVNESPPVEGGGGGGFDLLSHARVVTVCVTSARTSTPLLTAVHTGRSCHEVHA